MLLNPESFMIIISKTDLLQNKKVKRKRPVPGSCFFFFFFVYQPAGLKARVVPPLELSFSKLSLTSSVILAQLILTRLIRDTI